MRRFIQITLLLLAAISIAKPQSGWKWLSPGPTGNTLNDVVFINDTAGWAVGEDGTLIHTSDGGVVWDFQLTPFTHSSFRGVDFVSENIGWAVGLWGMILKTTNGGVSWFSQESNTIDWLNDVKFLTDNIGIIVGGVNSGQDPGIILRTTDAGETWVTVVNSGKYLNSLCIASDSVMYAVGSGGQIMKTKNGGVNWFSLNSPASARFDCVDFVDENTGWIIGTVGYTSQVFKTTDGGENWVEVYSGYFRNIHFTNEMNGWITAAYGVILKTSDGGNSWASIQVPSLILESSCSISDTLCWAVGYNGLILKSIDSGNTWSSDYGGMDFNLNSVQFLSENDGWVSGSDHIYRSTDGGVTWSLNLYNDVTNIFFISELNGWAIGSGYCCGNVYRTTDGGQTWENHQISSGSAVMSIYFVSDSIGWAVGYTELIEKTTDGGITWTTQHYTAGTYSLYSVFFTSEQNGFAVGESGRLFYTTDGGDNWHLKIISSNLRNYYVYFNSETTGWIIGTQETLLKTTDSGNTWVNKHSGVIENLASICFVNSETGWLVGSNGTILKTHDGGESWVKIPQFTKQNFTSVYFFTENIGWIAGEAGSLIKTTDGGVTFFEDEKKSLPSNFLLKQNYPNPFNPTTNIEFQIPDREFVTLKIYDILGNEVTTLVNEEKPAGSYTIRFDGSNLSSGIYFYRIKAGNYTATKKLILLK